MEGTFDDFPLLTVWGSPSSLEIAKLISTTLNAQIENNTPLQLYYIDATNSFPLTQFQKLVPVNEDNKRIYDYIRIMTCLDLYELNRITNKMLQLISIDKIQKKQNIKHRNKEPDSLHNTYGILVFINGLEVMFRNTQMKESQERTHLFLRDILLRIRAIANQPKDDNSIELRSIVTFPSNELNKSLNKSSDNPAKRPKSINLIKGNTIAEYVTKFYSDRLVS
ncbi:hypothetical protein Kpol_1003p5 [Vanderwaltozyma polyspora DSM 70294]|uniref:Uncharacterized protein n=1 Tax=Vanderwaltozyma polyspora (strain ATCC 22028 / DSM 70294 / BCRC 21397 / CBS 2163 / NBRC 10782 / NRRL Y-8283 / UCD 57-17) TaxID=436907 RepID=A7TLW3_VANPO|nr:uncharacterized protein Kpol_1003p5 [Vanderwaltozyma polyspora DSM 70294]EDO16700.1 hypothetical protein Kpol_1003p5 [Vanderwaltozyma polyspora DSM 70294]